MSGKNGTVGGTADNIIDEIARRAVNGTADRITEEIARRAVNGAADGWKDAYRELLQAVTRKGYPEEFGKAIAKNLGSEKMMRRMTSYLYSANPRSAEEIADEMLAIMSDRERWIQKKETEYYNSKYNELLNNGLDD